MDFFFQTTSILTRLKTCPAFRLIQSSRAILPRYSKRTLTSCLPLSIISSLISHGAATIKYLSLFSTSQRKTKPSPPANVSTPRSAMAQACGMIPASFLFRLRMKSRTSFSTTTSPHTFSESVRASSTLALQCQCLSSMKTARKSCASFVRKPVIAVSHLPMRPAKFRRYSTLTGVRSYQFFFVFSQ